MTNDQAETELCLLAYVLGQLTPADSEGLQAALAGDVKLRKQLGRTERMLRALRSDPDASVSRDLAPAVLARLPAEPAMGPSATNVQRGSPSRAMPVRWIGIAAAAAVVCLLLWRGSSSTREAVRTHGQRAGGGSQVAMKRAAMRACAWLARTQDAEGAWDVSAHGGRKDLAVAITGLGLLALAQNEEGFESAARRATAYLLTHQRPDGCFGPDSAAVMYNHGIATTALLCARKRLGLPEANASIERALAYLMRCQTTSGGWGYGGAEHSSANLGVSVWQLLALEEAASQGWSRVRPALERGRGYVRALVGRQGHVAYGRAGSVGQTSATLDAMAASCLLVDAAEGDRNAGTRILEQLNAASRRATSGRGPVDPYGVFFLSRAAQLAEDLATSQHAERAIRLLAARQAATGAEEGRVSQYTAAWGNVGGAVYATAMTALTIQDHLRGGRPGSQM